MAVPAFCDLYNFLREITCKRSRILGIDRNINRGFFLCFLYREGHCEIICLTGWPDIEQVCISFIQ